MTTADHPADWKVTFGYQTLLRIGWGALALASFEAVVAVVVHAPGAWWMAAGMALLSLLVVAVLPEPVPIEMITDRRNWIDDRRPAGRPGA